MKELLLKLVASDRKHLDGALLFLRLFIGGMMLSHGWAKLASFSTLSATFPDPLGVGSSGRSGRGSGRRRGSRRCARA